MNTQKPAPRYIDYFTMGMAGAHIIVSPILAVFCFVVKEWLMFGFFIACFMLAVVVREDLLKRYDF